MGLGLRAGMCVHLFHLPTVSASCIGGNFFVCFFVSTVTVALATISPCFTPSASPPCPHAQRASFTSFTQSLCLGSLLLSLCLPNLRTGSVMGGASSCTSFTKTILHKKTLLRQSASDSLPIQPAQGRYLRSGDTIPLAEPSDATIRFAPTRLHPLCCPTYPSPSCPAGPKQWEVGVLPGPHAGAGMCVVHFVFCASKGSRQEAQQPVL